MICNKCNYFIGGECILDYDGAYDADGNEVSEPEDVCMCEHHMELED